MVQSQFVDRTSELGLFEDLLRSDKPVGVLSIAGDGGAGKTWLMLRALQQTAENPRVLCVAPIDFYITAYHSRAGVRERLSQQLGAEYFADYHRAIDDLDRGRQAGQSIEAITGLEERANSVFVRCYNTVAERWDKVVLAFDTFEVVQDELTGQWLIRELLPALHRTVVLVSGRKNRNIDFSSLRDAVVSVTLGEISPNDVTTYFIKKGIGEIPGSVIGELWERTKGRPLLLDLVIDWIKENVEYESLISVPQHRFKEELVARVRELRQPRHRAILYMAWAYRRLDVEMLEWLMDDNTINYAALVEELSRLSFVKYREPIQSLLLHDEMRDLVVRHAWGVVDPTATERQDLSRRITAYYDERLIPEAAGGRERQILEAERLFYALYLDLGRGYEHFAEVFDKLFMDQRYDDCEILLVEIRFFMDRLPLPRLTQVEWRHAKLLQQRNQLDEAVSLLDQIITKQPDSELKISMYLTRSACAYRQGLIDQARTGLNEALELAERIQAAPDIKGQVESRMGYLYRILGRWDDAIDWLKRALRDSGDEGEIANILNTIGYVHALMTDYETALEYCQEGLSMRQRLGLRRGEGLSWSTLGEVYRYKGKYENALACYAPALAIFEEGDDEENIARVRQQRGVCYVEMGRYEEARADLLSSKNFYESSGNVRDYPRCLERVARLHYSLKDRDQARRCLEKAREWANRILDIDTAIYSLVWLAKLGLEEGEPAERIVEYRQQMDDLIRRHGYHNPQHQGQMKVIFGHALFREGKHEDALGLYAKGMADIAAQRRGEYLVSDYLREIDEHMKHLPTPEDVIRWSETFEAEWQKPAVRMMHPELVSFCEIRKRVAFLAQEGKKE
jgi:tetratricopeptide (TPR) repeat protein